MQWNGKGKKLHCKRYIRESKRASRLPYCKSNWISDTILSASDSDTSLKFSNSIFIKRQHLNSADDTDRGGHDRRIVLIHWFSFSSGLPCDSWEYTRNYETTSSDLVAHCVNHQPLGMHWQNLVWVIIAYSVFRCYEFNDIEMYNRNHDDVQWHFKISSKAGMPSRSRNTHGVINL